MTEETGDQALELSYLFKVAKDISNENLKRFSSSLSLDRRHEVAQVQNSDRVPSFPNAFIGNLKKRLFGNLIKVTVARTQRTLTRFTVLLFLILCPLQLFAQTPLLGEYTADANTVLLMHMNETSGSTLSDASSYGNNCTVSGTNIVDGKFGKTRSFLSTSDHIDVNRTGLKLQVFTTEAWVFLNSFISGAQHTIISNSYAGVDQGYYFSFRPDLQKLNFMIGSSVTNATNILSNTTFSANKWYHIAVSYDGSQSKIFINGILDTTVQWNKLSYESTNSYPLRIGLHNAANVGNTYFNGFIDEVRISNIVRSPQEFNLQLPPKNLTVSLSGSNVTLNWQNGGGAVPLMRYKIYRGSDSLSLSLIDSTSSLSRIISGLGAGLYYFRVSAVDSTGFEGAKSLAVNVNIINNPPSAPQNLTATAGNGQVTLKWNKNTEADFLKYRIYMGSDSTTLTLKDSTSASISDTAISITQLLNGSTYYFRVSAMDSARLESGQSYAVISTPSSPLLDMVEVTSGTFQMGSNDADDYGASPPHSVTLGSFYIDKYEVTYELWTDVRNWGLTHGYTDLTAGQNGSTLSGSPSSTTNNPVMQWNWYEVLKWCNARSEKDGLNPVYYTNNLLAIVYRTGELDLATDAVKWTANGYRLPTEAEWEFAARGGNSNHGYTYSGSNTIGDVAWYLDNSGSTTHTVGTKAANELGIHDMSGNIWEWCWDRYGAYSSTAQSDPKGATSGNDRLLRGGNFFGSSVCRVSVRYMVDPSLHYVNFFGFRCVMKNIGQTHVPPTAPQNLTVTAGNGQVILKWNKNTEADFLRYRIYGGTSINPTNKIDSTTGGISDTSKIITGLSNSTKYYFRITAVDSAGLESGYSNEVNATPYSIIQPPSIASFTPSSGPIGTIVTITGNNFNTTATNNVVYFGAVKAQVNSASSTSLSVTVPVGATYLPITVTDTTKGLTAYSAKPFIVTFTSGNNIDESSFAEKVDFTSVGQSLGLVIEDLDGDGKPDLATTNYSPQNNVYVLRNMGSNGNVTYNSFADSVGFKTGTGAYGIAMGDLDGDGNLDLIVGYGEIVSICRNTSVKGIISYNSFATCVDFTTSGFTYDIAMCDLNGDGKPDIVATNSGKNTLSVFRNTSIRGSITSNSLAEKVDFSTGDQTFFIAIGDLDGDGKPDLVSANCGSNTISVLRNTSLSDSIKFAERVDFATGGSPYHVVIGDLDGDGKYDLVVVNFTGNTVSLYRNMSVSGSISLAEKVDLNTNGNPFGVAIGDLNGDGYPDLAVANAGNKTVSVFRNRGISGNFTKSSFDTKVDFAIGNYFWGYVAIGDLNGDCKPDLVVVNDGSGSISVLQNTIPMVGTPPAAPQSLTATASNGQVTLKWNKNTEADFLRYRIYGGTSTLPTTQIDSTTGGISDTTKMIIGLSSGIRYYFRITAVNSTGLESGYSNEVNATPISLIPAEPSILVATAQ